MNQPGVEEEDEVYSLEHQSISKLKIPHSEIHEINQQSIQTLYEVTIDKTNNDPDVTNNIQNYKLTVKNLAIEKTWVINRKYEDFFWLFTALKVSLPGYIIPYFPSLEVIQYLNKKIVYLHQKERSTYLTSLLQELAFFLNSIANHPIFGFTEELRIFLIQNIEDFTKAKRNINMQIEELNVTESSSLSVRSLFERGLAWFSDSTATENIQWSKNWLELKYKFQVYSEQLFTLLEKMVLFKHSKEDEIGWKGPNTQIDAIELLKVKVMSGKPFSETLNSQLQSKIILPLINECKKKGQLKQQIEEKESIERLIKYLIRISGNEGRINKLMRRNEKFQTNFAEGWKKFNSEWISLVEELDQKFRQIFDDYSRHMYKIWK